MDFILRLVDIERICLNRFCKKYDYGSDERYGLGIGRYYGKNKESMLFILDEVND